MTRARGGGADPAHAPRAARPARRAHRPAPHAARLAAHRRRPDPPRAPATARDVRRRIVLLCDISGSMEPYARAYLQFLTCAGRDAEAFVFATRLTRITRALATRSPERAIQRAAAAAPDWSSGTRIGDALQAFNDRHGRRGMARGAVIVILSDGWERGDPALVAREMERLARLAYRIVWVNPRVAAAGFAPRVGGMAAALPYIDALVSGHTLEAHARGDPRDRRRAHAQARPPLERSRTRTWASATPVAGSSRGDAQRLQPEPRKDDARMDSPLNVCIYPGCDRPVVPPPEAGGPPSAFCDREDHNALTAHQERKRLGGARWLTRPIARCSCASTRPGKMVLSLTTRGRRQRGRLRAARRRRARRAGAGREGRARGREPLRLRPRVQRRRPSRRHARGDHGRDGQDPGQGEAARRASTSAATSSSGTTARSSAGGEARTIADLALYAHGTGALPPGVEGGLDAQTVYRD